MSKLSQIATSSESAWELESLDRQTYEPELIAVHTPGELAELQARARRLGWCVCDTIEDQLAELLRARSPSSGLDERSRSSAIRQHLSGREPAFVGRWVYYPWSSTLVHVLAREDYRELRLSRNRNKIDATQQKLLSQARIGIVGLSVGFSIAQTLVLEGVGGVLRLADHDTLCLSNLNRVPACNRDLGLNKAVVAARRLFELDPYLDIEVYSDGLTPDNTTHFITGGGTLQLVVEECDDLAAKIRVRSEARSHRVPVIMDTNDRGMIDIERFDLEPERPLLHGLLRGDEVVETLTPSERGELVRQLLGQDAMSGPLSESLDQIGVTLVSWPQLGSGTASGAGMVTDVARRILLNQLQCSGRFYADPEQLVHD